MTYLVAEQINNADWKQFAKQGMRTTLERAQYQQQFEPVSAFFLPNCKANGRINPSLLGKAALILTAALLGNGQSLTNQQ